MKLIETKSAKDNPEKSKANDTENPRLDRAIAAHNGLIKQIRPNPDMDGEVHGLEHFSGMTFAVHHKLDEYHQPVNSVLDALKQLNRNSDSLATLLNIGSITLHREGCGAVAHVLLRSRQEWNFVTDVSAYHGLTIIVLPDPAYWADCNLAWIACSCEPVDSVYEDKPWLNPACGWHTAVPT